MSMNQIRKVVIAGGGTSGWVAAAGLSRLLGKVLDITLVESEEIGTVGVGESTVPPIRVFHRLLRIDEQEFLRAVAGSFKLGIWFENWARLGEAYIHPFGRNGQPTWLAEFHHFWLRSQELGNKAELGEYNVEWLAAKQGRFATSPDSQVNFAYHFDAALYARYLRKLSEAEGVKRVEGKIKSVQQHPETGYVQSLTMQSGQVIPGDLFVDCTGFRGLLIEQTLHTGFEDWTHWLPCDNAMAFQSESVEPADPYTSAIAHDAGWRWKIPLQHRVGNGYVYCGRYMSDDEARSKLLAAVPGKAVKDPWHIRIRTGRRRKAWNKNVVSLGLAAGFVEPLESTSIHMIMMGTTRLLQEFPFNGIKPSLLEQFNDESRREIEHIRDFIVLHYNATERDDTPFWRYCRNMEIPDSLKSRIALFREAAHAYMAHGELFTVDSWVHVMLGQRMKPQHYHPITVTMSDDELKKVMSTMHSQIAQVVSKLPMQHDFIERYCKANPEVWQAFSR
jgi:tryptophan halogenase